MHVTLRIRLFPIAAILNVFEKSFPRTPLFANSDFCEVVGRQPLNTFAYGITANVAVLYNPLPD